MPSPAPAVVVRRETVVLPTYEPRRPDPNPMFLEKRVYQGSSGRVYPLPVIDRIAEKPVPRPWEAVFIENEFVCVMLLPAIGGRIHRILDQTNNHDAIYHQPVIKPALVGLAGPWCSGGIEFNWPQHHRPSTFMPADVAIEHHDDGSATVWLSEHDPMARMKGMHGVRLHPGSSAVELRARVYNRTDDVQTFLWWVNIAIRVHEAYQSFFPPDVTHVADHAKRAMSTFPHCSGRYYGVDYAARARDGVPPSEIPRQFVPRHCLPQSAIANRQSAIPPCRPDDLSWYANIPVPTSYMCLGSSQDFFGGYDHAARAGLIHVAPHEIAPGKKQWTWGNHEFGYAWDRNLTDADADGKHAPYIELMAGVFTDNQPDFSFLQPGETRIWSQFLYAFRDIGPAHHATADGAVSFHLERGHARIGVATTSRHPGARIVLECRGTVLASWSHALAPDTPFTITEKLPARRPAPAFTVRVVTADDRELLAYTPAPVTAGELPAPATEPLLPGDVTSADELYVIGLHLEQYRHATRQPEDYWREALRRDPGDSRCNLALGRWHLRRGEFAAAETHLRASIARLTSRNPNPADGEAHYQLGICLRHQAFRAMLSFSDRRLCLSGSDEKQAGTPVAPKSDWDHLLTAAHEAFSKATWNHAWQSPAFHALAEIAATRGDWKTAADHLTRVLRVNKDNLRARNLLVIALRRRGDDTAADRILRATRARDPLDWWSRHLAGETVTCDNQVRLDLAHDFTRAGLFADALAILQEADLANPPASSASLGSRPLVHYTHAWLSHLDRSSRRQEAEPTTGNAHRLPISAATRKHPAVAAQASADHCFPARLEEIAVLQFAIATNPQDAQAPYLLGNLFYDRRRHDEAIRCWERAVKLDPRNAVAWRNLGIGYYNIRRDPAKARRAYARAVRAHPGDARLWYERDQLWKQLGVAPARRLRELQRRPLLVPQRDDLAVEFCGLLNQTGHPERARPVVESRRFQPWEGGEGLALGLHVRTHVLLGRRALAAGKTSQAISLFTAALASPANLGEAKHLLANQSDVHYWIGCACAAAGDTPAARHHWTTAAANRGDFQAMSVRTFSEMTYFSARAMQRLGHKAAARKLLRELLAHAQALARQPATIDYFATSLPTMLLFDDDLAARQQTTALFLEAQARLGLGQRAAARRLLAAVLRRDPSHAAAVDLNLEIGPHP